MVIMSIIWGIILFTDALTRGFSSSSSSGNSTIIKELFEELKKAGPARSKEQWYEQFRENLSETKIEFSVIDSDTLLVAAGHEPNWLKIIDLQFKNKEERDLAATKLPKHVSVYNRWWFFNDIYGVHLLYPGCRLAWNIVVGPNTLGPKL